MEPIPNLSNLRDVPKQAKVLLRKGSFIPSQLPYPSPPSSPNKASSLRKMCSLKTVFCCSIVLIFSVLIVIFSIGFTAFISSTLSNISIRRDNDFSIVYDRVVQLMTGPKIITDAMAPALKAELLDFDDPDYEKQKNFTFWGIRDNFDRLGLASVVLYTANYEVDQFVAYHVYPNDVVNMVRRYEPFENCTIDTIYFCSADYKTGLCKNESQSKMFPWNRYGSITHQARTIYEPTFVEPYLFYCPGTMCDIYFAYTNPYHKNGQFVGTVGVAFESIALKEQLMTRTKSYASSFIVDITSGYMLSASKEEYPSFIQPTEGDTYQITALNHPNIVLKSVIKYIYSLHDDNFTLISASNHYHVTMDNRYYIEYTRFKEDGADWLIVLFSPVMTYFNDIIVFSVLFLVIIFVALFSLFLMFCSGYIFIINPLKSLITKMTLVEDFNLDNIERKFSLLFEIFSLENKFYFLLEKLNEYKSFLPYHLKVAQSPVKDCPSNHSSNANSGSSSSSSCKSDSGRSSTDRRLSITSNFSCFMRRFTQNINEKYITIVKFYWDFSESDLLTFVERHAELTSIILSNLRRGIIISMEHDGFLIAFNLSRTIVNHSYLALKCSMNTIQKAKDLEFNLYAGICTGVSNVGILGNNDLKVQVAFGETRDTASYLSKHAKYLNTPILTCEECSKNITENDYILCISDICFFPLQYTNKEKNQKVYSCHKTDELLDGEWMYRLAHMKKIQDQKDRTKYWTYLENNKLEECLKELESMKIQKELQKVVKMLIAEGKSYDEYLKERVEIKEKAYKDNLKSSFSILY